MTTVAFSPNGSRIVSGSDDFTLRLWNADTGQPIGEPLQGHNDFVKSVAFSRDGSRIVSGSGDNTLRIWECQQKTHWQSAAHTRAVKQRGFRARTAAVSFRKLGQRLTVGRSLRTAHRQAAARTRGFVSRAAFSPDGSRIVSGSWERLPASVECGHGANPMAKPSDVTTAGLQPLHVAYGPDGSRIASGSGDKTVRIWPDFKNLPEELCDKLTRNMSHGEWRDWVSPDIGYKIQCPGLPIPQDKS